MDDENDTVVLSYAEYEELKEAAKQLAHLERLGVDNWECYSYYTWDEE